MESVNPRESSINSVHDKGEISLLRGLSISLRSSKRSDDSPRPNDVIVPNSVSTQPRDSVPRNFSTIFTEERISLSRRRDVPSDIKVFPPSSYSGRREETSLPPSPLLSPPLAEREIREIRLLLEEERARAHKSRRVVVTHLATPMETFRVSLLSLSLSLFPLFFLFLSHAAIKP